MGLSNEKINELLTTETEKTIRKIRKYLDKHSPVGGTTYELADAIGVEHHRLWSALTEIRSASFVAENGWTIPNVRKGLAEKSWSIVRPEDAEPIMFGNKIRGDEMVEILRRLEAQLILAKVDARTSEGKYLTYVRATITSMRAAGEMVYDGATV